MVQGSEQHILAVASGTSTTSTSTMSSNSISKQQAVEENGKKIVWDHHGSQPASKGESLHCVRTARYF